jgi:hypothetical protein
VDISGPPDIWPAKNASAFKILAAEVPGIPDIPVAGHQRTFHGPPLGQNKPGSLESLVDWCAEIAAAAPQTPVYFHDVPALTPLNSSMPAIGRAHRLKRCSGQVYQLTPWPAAVAESGHENKRTRSQGPAGPDLGWSAGGVGASVGRILDGVSLWA